MKQGVYAPAHCFFLDNDDQDLDIATIKKHAIRLAKCGLTGLVIHGSGGEAPHLSREERVVVVKTVREALVANGFQQFPLIVGTGAQSLKETLILTKDAAEAGADFCLVLPPSYYTPAMSDETLEVFFNKVATASIIPLLLYNYPSVTSGIDLSSDLILKLSKHPNIVGIKLTCGNVGKLVRVTSELPADEFSVFGGLADFLVPGLAVGASGCIAGTANLVPRTAIQVFEAYKKKDFDLARKAQKFMAEADYLMALTGAVGGAKYALQTFYGYGGLPRLPVPELPSAGQTFLKSRLALVIDYEKSLE